MANAPVGVHPPATCILCQPASRFLPFDEAAVPVLEMLHALSAQQCLCLECNTNVTPMIEGIGVCNDLHIQHNSHELNMYDFCLCCFRD